ncbi:hypothetical protein CSOJ01_10821 [Colletotrichum sojae]|uniref:Uncharacterized protein n=1 Tax=Colletotrichum sojae TaxID=2175907 RepID=A0A8H6IZY0_9PEZI|nr:hypothetical protein CSOJ01_10821 [Colletotrichum sojae]
MNMSHLVARAVALLDLLSVGVQAHAMMQHPVPFPSQLLKNDRVSTDGSDWPCKGEKDYDWSGEANIWKRGSTEYLQAAVPFYRAPLVFEANNGNGCWTQNKGSCVKFFEPGESLIVNEECPLDESIMFTGECGPGRTLANLPGWWRWLSVYQIIGLLLVGAILLKFAQRVIIPSYKGRSSHIQNLMTKV